MSSPYRSPVRRPRLLELIDPRWRRTGLAALGLVATFAVRAIGPADVLAAQETDEAWSRLATCVLGPPLAPSETAASRLRAIELATTMVDDPDALGLGRDRWPGRCAPDAGRLHGLLVAAGEEDDVLLTGLSLLGGAEDQVGSNTSPAEEVQPGSRGSAVVRALDAFFAAAQPRFGAHRPIGHHPLRVHVPSTVDLPVLDRSLGALQHAGVPRLADDVYWELGAAPIPRLCRWSSTVQPLDSVACADVPAAVARTALDEHIAAIAGVPPAPLAPPRAGGLGLDEVLRRIGLEEVLAPARERGTLDATIVGNDIVLVHAADPRGGVLARRANLAVLASTPDVVIADDVDRPTRAIRLVTDGRGVVALLDDGDSIRALRLDRPQTWVPQVATAMDTLGPPPARPLRPPAGPADGVTPAPAPPRPPAAR